MQVTEYNVGRWCKSEDECIAEGIDFAAYERGVADAAKAFGRNVTPAAQALCADALKTVQALTAKQLEEGWKHTFSTDNPYCPCNLKSFTKAARWAEHALLAQMTARQDGNTGETA